eukprot:1143704-Pelagomonas_calceolata.AAC.3
MRIKIRGQGFQRMSVMGHLPVQGTYSAEPQEQQQPSEERYVMDAEAEEHGRLVGALKRAAKSTSVKRPPPSAAHIVCFCVSPEFSANTSIRQEAAKPVIAKEHFPGCHFGARLDIEVFQKPQRKTGWLRPPVQRERQRISKAERAIFKHLTQIAISASGLTHPSLPSLMPDLLLALEHCKYASPMQLSAWANIALSMVLPMRSTPAETLGQTQAQE